MRLPIALAAIALFASWILYNLWHSYSGATWVDSAHNLQYSHLEHDTMGSFIGGVFFPFYSSSGAENRSVRWRGGTITFSGKDIAFPRDSRFAVIAQDGTITFLDLPPECFIPDRHTRYGRPDIAALQKLGVWQSTIQPALGHPP